MNVTVVIPTIGRPSLGVLLAQLVSGKQCYNTHSRAIVVVDDRAPIATRVVGTVADALAGLPLTFELCDLGSAKEMPRLR